MAGVEVAISASVDSMQKDQKMAAESHDSYAPTPKGSHKFHHIRGCIQKLNEEFLGTLLEAEQRHKSEVTALRNELQECATLTEQKEQLQKKLETLTAQQKEHLVLIKKASDRIKKMESKEQDYSILHAKAEEKIKQLEAEQQQHLALAKQAQEMMKSLEIKEKDYQTDLSKANEKIQELQVGDVSVVALLKKADERIKELESEVRQQLVLASKAEERIKELAGEVETFKQAHEKISKEMAAQEEELKKAHERIKELEVLEEQLKQARDKIIELEDQEKDLHQARERIKELELQKAAEMTAEVTGQENRIKELEAELCQAQERIKQLEPQEARLMQVREKIKLLDSLPEELEQSRERIRKLESHEANQRLYVKKAGERIAMLESQARKRNSEKVNEMEAREEKVMALAKKAAQKIKELEAREKKHSEFSKKAALNIKRLKQMLLEKQDELDALQGKALVEFGVLAQDLAQTKHEWILTRESLEESKKLYLEEQELRRADQKKISSLRKMIEQYDDVGVECTWSDLSQAFSDESNEVNPLTVYRATSVKTQADFCALKDKVLACIPDSIQKNFNQVGFFDASEYHFPVLALGPFDIPPGPVRNKWLEKANTSLGIYYFGQTDAELAYDLIPVESFIPFYEGVQKNLHVIPAGITDKTDAGQELSPFEEVLVDGLKKINLEATSAPGDRCHPLKSFEEIASQESEEALKGPVTSLLIELSPTEMLESLKIKLCACSDGKEQIQQELDLIDDEAPILEATTKSTMEQDVKIVESEKMGSLNADEEALTANSFDSSETMNSLEKQMRSFITDLAEANKKAQGPPTPKAQAPTPKAKAPTPKATAYEEPVHREEARESYVSPAEEADTRDDAEQPARTSLVQQRLKMFGGQANTKNVMQMWKQKAASNSSAAPKYGSASTPQKAKKAFNFSNADISTGASSKSKTKSMSIPSNIQNKIEAGMTLSDHEKEILAGIQKFNHMKSASNSSYADAQSQVVTQTSTVPAKDGFVSAE